MATLLLEPIRNFGSMRQAMSSLLEDSVVWPGAPAFNPLNTGRVPVDIFQTEDELVVRAAVPGFAPDEINLVVLNGVLSLKGEHKQTETNGQAHYLRQEISLGDFERSFELPFAVRADKADAHFEHGILTVRLPKAEEAKPQQIKIAADKAIEGPKLSK
jgi:HSP20 family protein